MENIASESRLKSFLKTLRVNESAISMFLGAVVVVIVGILVYNYFSSVNKMETEPAPMIEGGVEVVEEGGQKVPKNLPITHKVEKGEHLWKIAEQYYGSGYNWVDIAEENQLANANILVEGQELVIPRSAVKQVETEEAMMAADMVEDEVISTSEYLVQKGDSLWKIAVRAFGDGYRWTDIWEANQDQVVNPDVIEAGMLLKLPR